MEFRFIELLEKFNNNNLKLISSYLEYKGFEHSIKEMTFVPDVLPNEVELKKDPNKRRTGSIAKYSNGVISFSPLSSQMIWYIAWLAYLIKDNKVDKYAIDDFICRLIDVDKGEKKDLSCKKLYAWDSYEVDSIFLYAMSFILCHELGHNVFNHPTPYDENFEMRDPELLKENEFKADSFAADCVTQISKSNESESELAGYGMIVAQIALMFIRNKEVHYINHPDPVKRLKNTLKKIDVTETMKKLIDFAIELSSKYLEKRFV